MTTYAFTITIDDGELIMLENILKERVEYFRNTDPTFKRLSDEGKWGREESVLNKLKESFKSATMTSTSSSCWGTDVKLWSPKE